MSETQTVQKQIQFQFHPYSHPTKHFVEKADSSGKKRRYLAGISSGIQLDQHSERMTDKCIKSFMSQANSGDVLLYPDIHGIKASEDIGILSNARIMEDGDNKGDWYTEYRLYDEDDGIGTYKLEKVNDIWKQITGQAPYKKARQKGFSIEGYIPDNAILSSEQDNFGNLKKRVIDDVHLDGVVLVPRPAYKAGIANAIYKALGELAPWQGESVRKNFQGELSRLMSEKEVCHNYQKEKWDINDALDQTIEKIMLDAMPDKQQQLKIIFEEYSNLMINLILQSESVFQNEGDDDDDIDDFNGEIIRKTSKLDIFKSLQIELEKLYKIQEKKYV